jgi:hypothetical protein
MTKDPFKIKSIKFIDPYAEPKKRTPVRSSDKKHLLDYQNGKCFTCKKSFKQMKVRPILHHKNLNPKDNRISNMILVCPNCHDKIHQKQQKVRIKTKDAFGLTTYKVVKRGVKRKSNKKKKRKKKSSGPLDFEPIIFKEPKFKF